ncbi:MAG: nucleotidyltransferase family protein, partial [Xanthobacteraceae bacterium]|nr:nucleotidyltransferase family protein [Xanthobacteraceae bacterium]
AFKMPGQTFRDLHRFWLARNRSDEYVGTLVNAYLAGGGTAIGVRSGRAYVDVGTLHGYRAAMTLLADIASSDMVRPDREPASAPARGDDLVHRRSEP